MSDNRARIRLLPLTARHPMTVPPAPKGYTALALMWRGEISYLAHEVLVRNERTGTLSGWTGGAMRSVDSTKAEAALAGLGGAEQDETVALDEKAELAKILKQWRGKADITTTRAGEMLGLSPRTIENIEQGRGFSHSRLLILALMAFE